jgi:uncharacterized membrane protein YkvA (DUF1232 family)
MAKNSQGAPVVGNQMGIIGELFQNGRLAWRLLRDGRVPSLLKFVVPGVVGAYLLMPIDLAPDFIPILGQLDDLAVLALAIKLFIELSPRNVVQELRNGLTQQTKTYATDVENGPQKKGSDEVVDVEYRVVD